MDKEFQKTADRYNSETQYLGDETGGIPNGNLLNGRYRILELVGKGGMGAVYKCLDIKLNNNIVAVKEISIKHVEEAKIQKVTENFKNEAAILIKLRHDKLPRVLDFFIEENDKCYIVMDFIEGKNLSQVISERGAIPFKEVLEWFYQLADVLKYLHTREPKIIFKDLKPSNIILSDEGKIYLIDFGIARSFDQERSADTTYYVSNGFSPPEQYGTGQCDQRADIYSLGVVLYSLLLGEIPKALNFKYETLKHKVQISDTFNAAIMAALEYNPENRPTTIDEMVKMVGLKRIGRKKLKYIIAFIVGIALIFVATSVVVYKYFINIHDNNIKSSENKSVVHEIGGAESSNIDREDDNTKSESEIGKYVKAGSYKGNDIFWRIIYADEKGILLVTDDLICSSEYGRNNRWDDSDIRKWLNDENGFFKSFNKVEKDNIVTASIQTIFDGSYEMSRSKKNIKQTDVIKKEIASTYSVEYTTQDKIFILSESEYDKYLNNDTMNNGKAKAIGKKEMKYLPYWLRSNDKDIVESKAQFTSEQAGFINKDGKEYYTLENGITSTNAYKVNELLCVRPAMYIKDIYISTGEGTLEKPYTLSVD